MQFKRFVISFSVASLVTIIIFFMLNDFGITWDEPGYMRYADQYVAYINRPIPADRDKFFMPRPDDIHPPLRKLIAGITHEIFTTDYHILDNTRGYRVSSLLFVFPFILLFTYIAIGRFGYLIGILTPLIFSFLPHVLFLTPLVTLDYAITALWFIAVITVMKGMKSYLWLTVSGLSIGFALLTKLYGYMLFIPIGGYWLLAHWDILHTKHKKNNIIPAVRKLLYISGVAFAVYYIGWPWLWKTPITHLGEYFRLQFVYRSVPEYIFGYTYTNAPWWYTPVMLFTTTPVFVLIFSLVGSLWTIRKGRMWDRFILLNALYPIIFFSLPGVYRYDWIRLFLPAYPFVCLLAGRGIVVTTDLFRGRVRILAASAVIVLWLFTLYSSVVRVHPWESAYYNELVGGTSGAARLGFETEFWGNSYMGILPWMNFNKGKIMCTTPAAHALYYYKAMGQLSPEVQFDAGRTGCEYLIVLMRQGFITSDPFTAGVVKRERPIYAVTLDGVPLIGVYDITDMKK